MRNLLHTLSLLLFCLFSFTSQLFGLGGTKDLALEGANIRGFAQNGSLVFATAAGPKGLFVSSDFGANWSFGSGGSYTFGPGGEIVSQGSKVYAILNRTLVTTPASLPLSWSIIQLSLESATAIRSAEKPRSLASDSNFLFVGTGHGNVKVVKLSDGAEQSSSSVTKPSGLENSFVQKLAVDATNHLIFAILNLPVNDSAFSTTAARLMSASYNAASGLIGSWQDLTANLGAGDFVANTVKLGGVFVAPNLNLYVTTINAGGKAGIYRSTDQGQNFTRKVSNGDFGFSLNIRSASFNGTTHLLGRCLSTNSGATFTEISNPNTSSGILASSLAVLVDSSNADRALAASLLGPIVTTDLSDADTSLWTESFHGMRGLLVNDFDQSPSNPALAVLGLTVGIARSTNFSLASNASINYTYPLVPSANGIKNFDPVTSVKIDPDDSNTVWAGSTRLYKGAFSSNGSVAWTGVGSDITGGSTIKKIVIAGNEVIVAVSRGATGGGGLTLFNRTTLAQDASVLSGQPLNALLAISSNIVYSGMSGADSSVSASSNTRGLFRSLDSGLTWTKITGNDALSTAAISSLAYDSKDDILYVSGNISTLRDLNDEESDDDTATEGGNVYIVRKASSNAPVVSVPAAGLPTNSHIGGLVVANKDGTQRVFAGVTGNIYVSNSKGATWSLLLSGATGSEIRSLIFDDLVQAGNDGVQAVSGEPNLIVSSTNASVKGGSRNAITLKLSKAFKNSSSNRAKVSASVGNIRALVSKRNELSLSLQPNGSWPSSGKIRLSVRSGFSSKDNERLDSDYDGNIDGKTFRTTITIKR